ncbi:MAG TPA: hypothetical protein VLP43_03025, partial [Solirubrobacteraceae bacterium]|nr:hypothetical protein [Solirubrobacteraceae bacterium]
MLSTGGKSGGGRVRGVSEQIGVDPALDGFGLRLWEAICGPGISARDRKVVRSWGLELAAGGVEGLELDGRQVTEVAVQALGVVPVHPAERREFDLL